MSLIEGDVIALQERVEELERNMEDLRETVGTLQGELRGANDWIAEHSDWINERRQLQAAAELPRQDDDDWGWDARRAPELDAGTYRDIEIQSGDR